MRFQPLQKEVVNGSEVVVRILSQSLKKKSMSKMNVVKDMV
jgi:hypothetical protein